MASTDNLSFTTEKEAVNTLLGIIGEAPVNSLEDELTDDVASAIALLREISREVQLQGWDFNTDHDYPMTRDGSGYINLPIGAAKVDIKPGQFGNVDTVIRGNRLYDRKNHTFVFQRDLKVDVTWLFGWDILPEEFRRYITIRAGRMFANRRLGSRELDGFTLRDEYAAKAVMEDAQAETADHTIFDDPFIAAARLRGAYGTW
jgi:hypothetical protein